MEGGWVGACVDGWESKKYQEKHTNTDYFSLPDLRPSLGGENPVVIFPKIVLIHFNILPT